MTMRARVLALLRVPHDPQPPAGDENVHVFRAAPNYLRYKLVLWGFRNLGAAIGLLWALQLTGAIDVISGNVFDRIDFPFSGQPWRLVLIVETLAVVGFVAQAVWSYLLLRLDFEQRWYIVSDRSLRIREGLVRLHEKTMTFANVQNVSVKQGPLQRLLGIADVEVRSAGGGDHSESGSKAKAERHVAYFRGVDNADVIRAAIRERLSVYRDAGLGDPDDSPDDAVALVKAAEEFAREARQLRLSIAKN